MEHKICKGLKVEVGFADSPASMTGAIVGVDSQTLVVSLAQDRGEAGPAAPMTNRAGKVQVVATGDDALYHFTSTLVQSSDSLLYLSLPAEARRVQRREDVRQSCLFDVELNIPRGERVPARRTRATAVNISCGGLLIIFSGRLEIGDAVALSIELPGGGRLAEVSARVVRTELLSRAGQELSRVALRLEGLQPGDRKRLTQFIMKCQIKARTATPTAAS